MMDAREQLASDRFLRSSRYHPDWVAASMGSASNALWLTEWLCEELDLRPGMRLLDLGCGTMHRCLTQSFLSPHSTKRKRSSAVPSNAFFGDGLGHMPRAFATTRMANGLTSWYAQLNEHLAAAFQSAPLFPIAHANAPTKPLIKPVKQFQLRSQTKVPHRSTHIAP